jgi:hypothetical protein
MCIVHFLQNAAEKLRSRSGLRLIAGLKNNSGENRQT